LAFIPAQGKGASALGYAIFPPPIPTMGNPKNKSQKFGMFLATQKPPHNTPQKPRIPPQTHHNFTTTKHDKIAKPRQKPSFSFPKFFLQNDPPPHPFRHQSR
jgi:hypothetical protein